MLGFKFSLQQDRDNKPYLLIPILTQKVFFIVTSEAPYSCKVNLIFALTGTPACAECPCARSRIASAVVYYSTNSTSLETTVRRENMSDTAIARLLYAFWAN